MKRYVVFTGDRCYAAGGALDYVMDFSRADEARLYRDQLAQRPRTWAHVWDTKLHTIYPEVEEDEHGYAGGIA